MRPCKVLLLLLLLLGATSAYAQKVPNDAESFAPPPPCDVTGYKDLIDAPPFAVPIPDENEIGVRFGPLFGPDDGSLILDVIVHIGIDHTWIGDLVAALYWDADQDGDFEPAQGPVYLLCRQGRGPGACFEGAGFGCSGNLASYSGPPATIVPYGFSDLAVSEAGDPNCTTTIPTGCYKPSGLNAGQAGLYLFRGNPKSGSWWMVISDRAPADLGVLYFWAVSIFNGPTATEASTWGGVKAVFR
jgi:hypothetical protein